MRGVVLALGGGCVGLLVGVMLFGSDSESGPAVSSREAAKHRDSGVAAPSGLAQPFDSAEGLEDIARLRATLEAEIARAERLTREVEALRDRLAETLADGDEPRADEPIDGLSEAGPEGEVSPRDGWIDGKILLGAGFHPDELDALQERFEAIELERLFIRDQATREGWRKTGRFSRQMARLRQEYEALRDEYGEDDYDWILYASGRPNRVVAKLVMQKSPAAGAGLEPGDVLVAYGGRRVLRPSDLQHATSQGTPGGTVALDVVREGEELRFYLPVGPLGVQLDSVQVEPPPRR
jgi:hypothetical protein